MACCCCCCHCPHRAPCGSKTLRVPAEILLPAPEVQQQIVAEHTGNNHAEIAKKFGLSQRTIYRILKRHHPKGTQS